LSFSISIGGALSLPLTLTDIERGKNGKDRRSFGFAEAFGHGRIPLNDAP